MLHPVGPLPAAVYWRRRLVVLTLLVSVLGGGGWLGATLLAPRSATGTVPAGATSPRTVAVTPALERVVPSLGTIQRPRASTSTTPPPATAAPTSAAAVPGGPCSDAMLSVRVRAPATAAVGSSPTFDLVVTNTSGVPCVRAVDKGVQEMVLLDAAGGRVWGSNDCSPGTSSDTRTLAPGEVVSFPVLWAGLTSEPTCTAKRVPPPAGAYVLRGRLDTLTGPDTPITLT